MVTKRDRWRAHAAVWPMLRYAGRLERSGGRRYSARRHARSASSPDIRQKPCAPSEAAMFVEQGLTGPKRSMSCRGCRQPKRTNLARAVEPDPKAASENLLRS